TIVQQNKNGASVLMPTQNVTGGMGLSVSIFTQGGNGAGNAGAGGDVLIVQNLDGIDATLAGLNPLYMAGYDLYESSGGNGAGAGVSNSAQLFADGGNGTAGAGGAAGSFLIIGHAQVTYNSDLFAGGGNATGAAAAGHGGQAIIAADGTVSGKGAAILPGGNS